MITSACFVFPFSKVGSLVPATVQELPRLVLQVHYEVYDRSFRSILYRPLAQVSESSMDFALRASTDPHSLTATVRSTIANLDATQPITLFQTMAEKIKEQASALQFVAVLMGLFGLAAIVLSAAGIYGLIAYSVAERHREIGIRMALGAKRSQVLGMVVRLAVSLVSIGDPIGLVVGFVIAQFLSSLLLWSSSLGSHCLRSGAPAIGAGHVARNSCSGLESYLRRSHDRTTLRIEFRSLSLVCLGRSANSET